MFIDHHFIKIIKYKLCFVINYGKISFVGKRLNTILKDCAVGVGIGTAIIIPGISGGTIALISGEFKRIVDAVDKLISKYFLKNLLILLPFGIGAILAIAGLYIPITLAFEHCMLALVCLFATFMVGSVPSVFEHCKGSKPTAPNIIGFIIGLLVVILFGVLSIYFNLNNQVQLMFDDNPIYLYPILFGVGMISSMGLIVPGFSGSMLIMVIGFYDKILALIKQIPSQPGWSILRLFTFAVGVAVGFIIFSKVMKYMFEKHNKTTNYIVLGFLVGSIIAIFVNSQMFAYFGYYPQRESKLNILDYILSPIFSIIGLAGSLFIYFYFKKHPEKEQNAEDTTSVSTDER